MKKRLLTILAPLIFLLSVPILALAEEWTPMITSSSFDGIKADGTLTSHTIPAGQVGNEKPIAITP